MAQETRFGDFVLVRDFRGDIEVYRQNDRQRNSPVFYTMDWGKAVAFAKSNSSRQSPVLIDRIGSKAD